MFVPLGAFLTDAQMGELLALYRTCKAGTFAKQAAEKVIKPNLSKLNAITKQENDPMYVAYVIEHVFSTLIRKGE
jgi:hypothetical protein